MPFKRAGWLQRRHLCAACPAFAVSMPFKRAGWLQRIAAHSHSYAVEVSMPFKRAGWLQHEPLTKDGFRQGFNAL